MANVIKFQKDMRTYIRIVEGQVDEQADADDMYGDVHPETFGRKNGQSFSDHGRADIGIRQSDARFADNPMEIDEFAEDQPPHLDQLHQALTRAGLSDAEICKGIDLTHSRKMKIAGRLGISTHEVDTLMNTLMQDLNNQEADTTDALLSDYYTGMSEGADAPMWTRMPKVAKRPFDEGTMIEDRFSVEPDALGNITIRDQETGKERFLQATDASSVMAQLDRGADPDAVLSPLMEDFNQESTVDFADEINAESGSYNFQWTHDASHGTGTVIFSLKNGQPDFKMASVRDAKGDDILDHLDDGEYQSILQQAKDFIGQA